MNNIPLRRSTYKQFTPDVWCVNTRSNGTGIPHFVYVTGYPKRGFSEYDLQRDFLSHLPTLQIISFPPLIQERCWVTPLSSW